MPSTSKPRHATSSFSLFFPLCCKNALFAKANDVFCGILIQLQVMFFEVFGFPLRLGPIHIRFTRCFAPVLRLLHRWIQELQSRSVVTISFAQALTSAYLFRPRRLALGSASCETVLLPRTPAAVWGRSTFAGRVRGRSTTCAFRRSWGNLLEATFVTSITYPSW